MNVECPQCQKEFRLTWAESKDIEGKVTLVVRACPSGGVYDVALECPHCDYTEEL